MRQYQIRSNEAGQRFDKYLKKLLVQAPGSFLYKMLRKKNIVLNGKKADGTEKLESGDIVQLYFSEETFLKFTGEESSFEEFSYLKQLSCELAVVYEDADIVIVNKPSGMLSQKAKPSDVSANEYILSYLIGTGELTEEVMRTFRPSICNRLDRNTSGILIAGKTLKGLQEMSVALKERSVQKYYRCIVKGEVEEAYHIKGWLRKDEEINRVSIFLKKPEGESEEDWQEIETEYRPIARKNGFSELEVHLITGRSHQIRAHLASIGYPIVGDFKYGDKNVNQRLKKQAGIESQLLHAYRIVFGDAREVKAPCGTEFVRAWDVL